MRKRIGRACFIIDSYGSDRIIMVLGASTRVSSVDSRRSALLRIFNAGHNMLYKQMAGVVKKHDSTFMSRKIQVAYK